MTVKEYYPHFSEQLMYEWTLEKPTAFNKFKRQAYAFWHSVKNEPREFMCFEETLLLDKIQNLHDQALGCRRGTIGYKRQRR
jgi:hypothetical protein